MQEKTNYSKRSRTRATARRLLVLGATAIGTFMVVWGMEEAAVTFLPSELVAHHTDHARFLLTVASWLAENVKVLERAPTIARGFAIR
jgi:hypothetical protein